MILIGWEVFTLSWLQVSGDDTGSDCFLVALVVAIVSLDDDDDAVANSAIWMFGMVIVLEWKVELGLHILMVYIVYKKNEYLIDGEW